MKRTLRIKIKRLGDTRDIPLPVYRSRGATGMDLVAAITNKQQLAPMKILAVPCGIAIALPKGYEAQIRPVWGLASAHGVTVLNSPGTVDSDFRGEINVILINHGVDTVEIERGMTVAHLIVMEVPRVLLVEVIDLPVSVRSSSGFGHTGN